MGEIAFSEFPAISRGGGPGRCAYQHEINRAGAKAGTRSADLHFKNTTRQMQGSLLRPITGPPASDTPHAQAGLTRVR